MSSSRFQFLRPLTAEEYAGLKASIAEHGQLVAIVVDDEGNVLEGNHRQRILRELGVPEAAWKMETKAFADDDAKIAFVLAANVHRRHTTTEDRKRLAEYLYGERQWTMQRIGEALGVTHKTVSIDLDGFVPPVQTSRPKGGRPKGSSRRTASRKNDSPLAAEAASLVLDQGMTNAEAGAASGLGSELVTRIAVAREEGRREALEEGAALAYVANTKSAKEKVEAATRHHRRKLDQDFDARVLAEVKRRMDEIVLPAWRETIERAEAIVKRDKGVMTSAEYKHVRSCLHPDRVQDASLKVRFAKAFGIFEKLEKFLCKPEKEPPAKFPRTWQEAQSSTSEQEHPNG